MHFFLFLSAITASAATTINPRYIDWKGRDLGPGKGCACMELNKDQVMSSADEPEIDWHGMDRPGIFDLDATERCCTITAGKDAWDEDGGACDAKLVDYEGKYGDDFEKCCVVKNTFNACHNQLRKGEKEYTDVRVEWEDGKRVFKDYSEDA